MPPLRLAQETGVCTTTTFGCPREKQFGKYRGTRDDRVLEDWISDVQRAVRGQWDGEAVDILIFHLEGVAKEDVKLRPTAQLYSPSGVFKILREVFSEQLTETQAKRKFFARQKGDLKSVQDFAHALMVLLSQVEQLMINKDMLLKEQFMDPTLYCDIKRWREVPLRCHFPRHPLRSTLTHGRRSYP